MARGFAQRPETLCNNTHHYHANCAKNDIYEWTKNIPKADVEQSDVVEVRFKNSSRNFYRNIYNIVLKKGDIVVVEADHGQNIGIVSATGNIALMLLSRRYADPQVVLMKKLFRKIQSNDVEKWVAAVGKEESTLMETRQIIADMGLDMKLNDVEYQGDGYKATFYYTAEGRVDFRELIKVLAETFKVRIEMKQIGMRQEAGRLGGIGSCGRELCCATWMSKFSSVSTERARSQQLTLNLSKLAGQCGKLKCCLNFEYDMYVDALKDFPDSKIVLKTETDDAVFVKSDIIKKIMWYSYAKAKDNSIMAIPIDKVKDIIEMNKNGKKPEKLEDFAQETEQHNEDHDEMPQDLSLIDD